MVAALMPAPKTKADPDSAQLARMRRAWAEDADIANRTIARRFEVSVVRLTALCADLPRAKPVSLKVRNGLGVSLARLKARGPK